MHVEQHPIDPKPSRKGKERDPALPQREPQPTDLDQKLTALRRRTAATTRPRDRSERDRMQVAQPTQPNPINNPVQFASTSSISRIDRSPKLSVPAKHSPSSPHRHASPHLIVSRPTQDADHEDFSRRLKISSPAPRHQSAHKQSSSSKLFNPDTDPIPMRRTAEPEVMSDATGSSNANVYASRATPSGGLNHREERGHANRQLFDHRKDDPVRFSVLARPQHVTNGRPSPTPKSSGDYVSASSTSSYAASLSSSAFTLSSTTDGSSASSALFEGRPNQGQGTEDSGHNSQLSAQLKKLYRYLTALETKIKQDDSEEVDDAMTSRVMLKGKEAESEEVEKEKWRKRIEIHKQYAETAHLLLQISSAPSVPVSLRNIPSKYNIIVRLWNYAFHNILESLRRAFFTSNSIYAGEHLQEYIYYAYTFYSGLLIEYNLSPYKSGWLEALGDVARYRMHLAATGNGAVGGQGGLTTQAVSEAATSSNIVTKGKGIDNETGIATPGSPESVSDAPPARIDDSPSPSIGPAAARLIELEPERERWCNIARDWYGAGLAEQPGTGKFHHHLGVLSRDAEGEDLRSVYHFVKSLTTLHTFPTARESILPIWSHVAQARRSAPDARASELFVFLHGMLFTNIQLDDFQPTLARFIERLEIEGAEEREWIMMAVVNIASILEYGKPNSVLRKIGCVGPKEVNGPQVVAAMRVMAKKAAGGAPSAVDEEKMDIDDDRGDEPMKSPTILSAEDSQTAENSLPEQPPALKFAMQITFAMLSHVLRRPTRKSSQFSPSNLNPYLTVLLTFLSTILKHKPTLDILERSIPWEELALFFSSIPRKIMISQGLMSAPGKPDHYRTMERWVMLTSGCTPPLKEDWCLRGMEWVGRKVYERGFWKSGEDTKAELEVLDTAERPEATDGTIEDDDGEDDRSKNGSSSSHSKNSDIFRRYVRIARSAVNISSIVEGFNWTDGTRDWKVEGKLAEKVKLWEEEDRIEREEEERRRMGKRWVDDAMDVDEGENDSLSESEDDEDDSPDVKALKDRRRYLKSLLQSAKRDGSISSYSSGRPRAARSSRKPGDSRALLPVIPGYTILVVDTNILLSSLSMFSSLIESMKWTVIVPLPVIMELDGLSTNPSQLGEAAQAAMTYIHAHIRSHAVSLKVQTSKGNYLTSLTVRTEEVDFHGDNAEKSMDDLILKAAIWQDDHWVDRSSMLQSCPVPSGDLQKAIKVVLLSLDRNLRLKARSRQLPAASEKDLAAILAMAT
ncbi:Telomerase-binding protein EST1A [Psilocybe cubensis]|uniref:PIN domain-containing protein n=2 Tax=Psilocybe cubensis TaxID=181762 RepID=A0A8H7Y4S3_PSICU|nr:Telomerase-binding protein EST1A [Psilocybe cubensis]KAH9483736.1 Telomerase-binding protein EST1A [Psilocybe cubensis]